MKRVCALLFISISSLLCAALSPIHQSIYEIDAILHSPTLTKELGQNETIEEIQHIDGGYLIVTENYELTIDLIYERISAIGPRKFYLKFHTPRER